MLGTVEATVTLRGPTEGPTGASILIGPRTAGPATPFTSTAEARALFESTMAEQVEMSLEEHDRLIAFVLGLSHALNIAFFTALAESGTEVPLLSRLSSTTFDAQLEVCRKVARENPWLYFEIQSLNEHGPAALSALARSVERIRDAINAGDADAFVQLMEQVRDSLASRRPPEGV